MPMEVTYTIGEMTAKVNAFYKIIVNILWAYRTKWTKSNAIIRGSHRRPSW